VTLEYFCSRDATFAFLTGSHEPQVFSLNLTYSDLTRISGEYLESLKSGDGTRFEALSRSLYNRLIAPILPDHSARSIDSLVIVPDGPLYSIPFGSLLDARGEFLLEKFPISYAPSRTVLHYCLSMNRPRQLPRNSAVLLLDGTANLPAASSELAQVAKIYSAASTLIGPADLARLDSLVGRFEAIHFSGHADIHGRRPRLIFQGSPDAVYLDSSLIEKWNLPRNCLVSLLGCSTGVGPVSDGESAWGLVPSFLSAGAPTLLVSLLPLDDSAAARITIEFYRLLAQGADSKASALRGAQLSLLRSAGPEGRRRPGSWAPLVLLGDPR
jgi:CHAT domain-containing protein